MYFAIVDFAASDDRRIMVYS